ncbi:MAG: hypothetical protein K8W52_01625 [Deltaproteobacteria bacterium]|nr:hypothetical protein [Deltaproteobacteria bacterium]
MTQRTDWTVPTAGAAIACLVAMFAVTLATGASQEQFELARPAAAYAADLQAHGTATRVVFAIDTVFLVLYSAFFLMFAQRVATPATRTMLAIAVGAVLLTAVLDMIEDHHILAMLGSTEAGAPPSAGEIAFQHTLSQVKFNVSYLGLFLFGLTVPRTRLAGTALALLLTIGTLVQGAWLYVAPLELQAIGSMGRWVGFIAGFALAIAVVRSPDVARAPGVGSGAPA